MTADIHIQNSRIQNNHSNVPSGSFCGLIEREKKQWKRRPLGPETVVQPRRAVQAARLQYRTEALGREGIQKM